MQILAKTGVAIENFLGIDGFDIYWYGICIATGFLLAFVFATLKNKKWGGRKDLPSDMLIVAIIGALIGARAYYVAFEWDNYFVPGNFGETLKNIFDIRSGGLAIYGGIIGAVITLGIYAFVKKENLLNMLDIAAAPLALGQAIGRWGNFFNQEAHGAMVTNESLQWFPYAVYLDSPKANEPVGWYQATFFYESFWCLLIFVTLYFFVKRKYKGQIVLMYLALYGFERGIVEWLRTDQLTFAGGVPISAVLSIALCIAATTLLIIAKVKNYNNIEVSAQEVTEVVQEAETQKSEEEEK